MGGRGVRVGGREGEGGGQTKVLGGKLARERGAGGGRIRGGASFTSTKSLVMVCCLVLKLLLMSML